MKTSSRNLPEKYRVFLLSTFSDRPQLAKTVLQCLARAGLFFYFIDEHFPNRRNSDEKIRQEVEDSDILVLLIDITLGTMMIKGKPLAQYIFELAQELEKPILVYSIGGTPIDEATTEFLNEITKQLKCDPIAADDEIAAANIISDINNLMVIEQGLSYWVRPDVHQDDVKKIIEEMSDLNSSMILTDGRIRSYESRIEEHRRHTIVGSLIDAGLRQNTGGKAHRFVSGQEPDRELSQEDFEYDFYIDRFMKHESFDPNGYGLVYDRLLDITWFFVPKLSFGWYEAMDWRNHIDQATSNFLMGFSKHSSEALNQWRLPDISTLMTLLTYSPCDGVYLDTTFFPNDTHWFWSSSIFDEATDKPSAYYMETVRGQILRDPVFKGSNAHRKAIFLYKPGLVEGKYLDELQPRKRDDYLEDLKTANESRRLYGIYLSVMAEESIKNLELLDLEERLADEGYSVSSQHLLGARNSSCTENTRYELSINDYYLLILNDVQHRKPDEDSRIQEEIRLVRDLDLPICIFHNLSEAMLGKVTQLLGLSEKQIEIIAQYPGFTSLAVTIIAALEKQRHHSPVLGWMRENYFNTINRGIEEINRTIAKVDNTQPDIERFIELCNVRGLREEFENYKILIPAPKYGTQVLFVSKDTPFHRFSQLVADSQSLPTLYVKYPNRFSLVDRADQNPVVFDDYLKLFWWINVQKHTTYEEALAWAETISQQENEDWRLPTVKEMITLVTYRRGNRKYMDEIVFPTGRWFWTGTIAQNKAFYVDCNYYMPDSVGLEALVAEEQFPKVRKKTALLVSERKDRAEGLKVFVSYSSTDAVFVKGLVQDLRTPETSFWTYQEDILPGSPEWDREVEKALEKTDVMLLVWSPDASKSREVHNEWNYFLSKGKPILILVYRDHNYPLHFRLELIQRITYSPQAKDHILATIRQALKRL